jgi:aminoglycoside phosphotransferase (APT) family kinase protein
MDSSLLSYLSERVGSSQAFAAPPAAMSGGWDTRVYWFQLADAPPPYDRPLVLRLFPSPADAPRAATEFEVQRFVHHRGYPAPEPLLLETGAQVLGGPFMVMERVPGRPLRDHLAGPSLHALRAASLLAEAHVRLHRLPASGFPGHEPGTFLQRRLDLLRTWVGSAGHRGLTAVGDWLEANKPAPEEPEVVCHGDFHVRNVLVDHRGAVRGVVDWTNAVAGDRHLDVAVTLVSLRGSHRRADALGLKAAGRHLLARRYLAGYERRWPLDHARLAYFETLDLYWKLVKGLEWHDAAGRGLKDRAYDEHEVTAADLNGIARAIERMCGVRARGWERSPF